jgi:LPS-assembly lipoprotein
MRMKQVAPAILLVAVMLLGGCAMRPLYGTSSAEYGVGVPQALESVTISEAETRLGQLIRNDLISGFRPAGTDAPDRYRLVINSRSREENAVEEEDSHIARRTVRVNVAFILSDISSGKAVYSGRTFSVVSYDRTGQGFADLQAETNAMERAAKVVSTDIRTRVAAYFASQ